MVKSIPYGKQHITQDDINAVVEVLNSQYLTTGPKVKEFEKSFSNYVGSEYAVAVSNGTAALHLCALALNVNDKSKVITTPITFAATANCVRYCGGQIEFCDIDPDTLVMDIVKLKEMLESAPKGTYEGIIPVDFAGYPVNMESFRSIANEYGLWVLEDACHAPGGYFIDSFGKKQFCGNCNYADLAIFSFHPVKHIACGEGGMITTNNRNLYNKLLQLRSHGMVYQGNPALLENHGGWYMEMQSLGYNYRISDILCALGISQLKRANTGLLRRKEIALRYDEAFHNTEIKIHVPKNDIGHAYHLYVIELDERKRIYDMLRQHNIYSQIHYVPLHTMPYYRMDSSPSVSLINSETYYEKCLSLPIYPSLSKENQEFVIKTLLKIK